MPIAKRIRFMLLATLLVAAPNINAAAAEASSGDELRNTVINLLESLVQKGILTREQVQTMVADAKSKTEADAQAQETAAAASAADERDAVRVTYVPEIVREQIAKEVSKRLQGEVTTAVVQRAKRDGWGIPGALPDWVRNLRLYGDVRARAENNFYAGDNVQYVNGIPQYTYRNFSNVNAAGGLGKAGVNGLLNVSENRPRLVGRARLGVTADLGSALKLDLRLASGAAGNPISTNQTLGNYGARSNLNLDKAAILWTPQFKSKVYGVDLRAGRFDNPFVTGNELIWDNDVTFEGVSVTGNWNYSERVDRASARKLFATVGAFPLQEVELSNKDKWLYGAQLGTELRFGISSRLRFAAALYNFANVAGTRNAPDSVLLDFTAPRFLTKGNTLFDIRNDTDTSTNLFALASNFKLASGLLTFDTVAFGENRLQVTAEYVKNIGWNSARILARTGSSVVPRTRGYELAASLGRPKVSSFGDWRFALAYRYLERDAVLDAFTDSDFHLGGTDAKGYILTSDFGLGHSAFARVRYMSANAIDGAPLGIDVLQLDLVGQF